MTRGPEMMRGEEAALRDPTRAPSGSPELFAATTPDAPAIVEGDDVLTWAEWDERANRLCNALADLGIGAMDRVGVRSQIRPEWFVVNQALAKLGAIQVAVNWRLTPPEARYILEDSGACAMVFDDEDPAAIADAWGDLSLKALVHVGVGSTPGVARYADLLARGRAEARIAARPAPLILYTSGTTGRPKGAVPNPQKLAERGAQVLEYALDVARAIPQSPGARTLLTMPLHHGAGPAVARGALSVGGTVYLLRRYHPERALEIISRHQITHWTAVPTMLHRVKALPDAVRSMYDVSSLQALNVGAAPTSFSLKEWIFEFFGHDCLYEGYGATEIGMVTTMPPEMQLEKPGSCGRLYKHVEVRVLDDDGKPLPSGETGELWIKTPVAIDRYLNRDALGPDTLDEDGFFRVGDVGRIDEDGYVYITDRKKDMIIAGGVNIYPAEIEAALVKHPAVVDVAVIGIPDEDLGEQIVAFCEIVEGASVTEQEIVDFAAEELAAFKRPRSVEFVDELPRNPTGKVMKTELRAPYWEGRERSV